MAGKVSIIGAGNVGTATAFAVAMDGTPDEVVLFDCNLKKAEGEIMDIVHASAFLPTTSFRASESYDDVANSDVIVITAGAKQHEGETRLALLDRNLEILYSIVTEIAKEAPEAIIVVVSNPVDILTYFAQQFSGFPAHRVIGTGTMLDTARFREFLAHTFDVSPKSVDAYILGEHGDSSFPALSTADIGGVPLQKMSGYSAAAMKKVHEEVVQAAYEVIERKGSTSLAIGVCVQRILHAILNNTQEIYPVSSVLDGEYRLRDVAMSTPAVLGRTGIRQRLTPPLAAAEARALKKSAKILKTLINEHTRERASGAWCPR